MPELPEVETMVRGIRPFAEGRRIRAVLRCKTRCKPITITPPFATLTKKLVGNTITTVRRLGKRIALDLSNESSLAIEPRMTGLMLLANPPDVEHLRVEWQLEGKREYNSIWFWDRRGLGTIRLYKSNGLEEQLGLGPDPLGFTTADWVNRLGRTRRAIKVALLDQTLVAGIGNLYASEILHVAKIDPRRSSESLTSVQIEQLGIATKAILERAIATEGSTLGDGTYRNALSQSGQYQNEHRVYMREGEKCVTCGNGIVIRLVQSQRSTFYCPDCQR